MLASWAHRLLIFSYFLRLICAALLLLILFYFNGFSALPPMYFRKLACILGCIFCLDMMRALRGCQSSWHVWVHLLFSSSLFVLLSVFCTLSLLVSIKRLVSFSKDSILRATLIFGKRQMLKNRKQLIREKLKTTNMSTKT